MTYQVEDGTKGFIFMWKIKNFSYCWHRKGDYLESPSFVVDSLEGTKWKLSVFPRGHTDGNFIGLFLKRDPNCNGLKGGISLEVELSVISWKDIKPDHTMKNSSTLAKGANFGNSAFQKRKDIFMDFKDVYLPEDVLVICCKMWKSDTKSLTLERYSATTHITVGSQSFLWTIEKVSAIEPDKENTICVKSSDGRSILTFNLSLIGGPNFDESFQIQMTSNLANMFTNTSFYLLKKSGDKEECGQCEFWFDRTYKNRYMTLFLTKKKLLAKKSQYLPKDTLTLQCECKYSTGDALEEVEKIGPGCVGITTDEFESSKYSADKSIESSITLEDNLEWLYSEGFMSDVELKTNSKTFFVHKIILCARSPVFKAMLTNDMKEKSNKVINVMDLDDDILHMILLYIYTEKVDDLTWESALQLYEVADKYEIETLKMQCSALLETNITINNACDVLILADLHQDGKLKLSAQKFILKNEPCIIKSKKWEIIMENNLKLAADTLCLRYK